MLPQEIIRKKRDKQILTVQDIEDFVQGIDDWSITDGQVAAMLMAALVNGLNHDEIIAFVNAIVDTGIILDWESVDLNGPVASVYTMPGVGDKSEIIAAPLLAACGIYVPMICERMQYHAGGTLDKLDSIKGFASRPTLARFKKTLRESGCAFMTPTEQIAPADLRIQSIRDVTATVTSIPLMLMSMLVKKVASGIKNLTVDVKVGNGSFTPSKEEAENCAKKIKECAPAFGIKTDITFSQMDHLVGQNVGNALEVFEAWDYLTGSGPRDQELHTLIQNICSTVLIQNKIAANKDEAFLKIDQALSSGQAADHFGRMLYEQGVLPNFISNPALFLPAAQVIKPVYPDREGYVSEMNMRWIGLAVLEMGAGRFYQEQRIDYSAGFSNMCRIGMYVSPRVPLAFVHADDTQTADLAAVHLKGAIKLSEQPI
ncbi:MAG: thymidine phosphorylase [Alphaproteobacteria bacterium]|nr:thymidine phosphorylase [Alphaproteobacteria bacterium]